MNRSAPGFVAILLLDVLLLVISLFHLPSVARRPGIPFESGGQESGIRVTRILDQQAASDLRVGDYIRAWDVHDVRLPESLEFLADMKSIGSRIPLTIERDGTSSRAIIALVPFYPSPRFLIIITIVGIVIWMVGVFVHWNATPGITGAMLHWTMITFAVTVLITPGQISHDRLLSYVERALFLLSYVGVTALFFYFTLLYPTSKAKSKVAAAFLIFVPVTVLAGAMSILQLSDLNSQTIANFSEFQVLFDLFQFSLFVYVGGAALCIVLSLRKASTPEERKRMQWIVWGLSLGATPFLFLHILPQLLASRYIIPEEYATIFFLAIPFSFSISFLRYHFLDIEILINRSLVYGILSILVVVALTLAFLLVTSAFDTHATFEEYLVIAGVSLLMAWMFTPARVWLQTVIDEALFATRANFRSFLTSLTEQLHRSLTSEELYTNLAQTLSERIPVAGIAVYEADNGGLRLRARTGGDAPSWILLPTMNLNESEGPVWVLPGSVASTRYTLEASRVSWLQESGFSVCLIMTDGKRNVTGATFLTPRARGDRFQEEEVDLLVAAGSQASEILSRLNLQQEMFLEVGERTRLQELSDLKSYFVSSVSHELRMPLTSIRMFAETLRMGKVSGARRKKEYLRIIEGESERLGRLIENVLNFAKIERGLKEYTFAQINPGVVAKKAAACLQYEFKSAGGKLRTRIAPNLPTLEADGEALQEMILNLLSNALKYSTGRKIATLVVRKAGRFLEISVADKGIGIPEEELPNVFEKFYRVRDLRSQQVGGTGLGLSLVRHIAEAHGGTIDVSSTVGKGSVFTVHIPLKR